MPSMGWWICKVYWENLECVFGWLIGIVTNLFYTKLDEMKKHFFVFILELIDSWCIFFFIQVPLCMRFLQFLHSDVSCPERRQDSDYREYFLKEIVRNPECRLRDRQFSKSFFNIKFLKRSGNAHDEVIKEKIKQNERVLNIRKHM